MSQGEGGRDSGDREWRAEGRPLVYPITLGVMVEAGILWDFIPRGVASHLGNFNGIYVIC